MYQVKLVFEYGAPRPNVKKMAEDLGARMAAHWGNELRSGNQADGTSLPDNKEGQPMGRGDGSFASFQTKKASVRVKDGLPTATVTIVPGRQEDPRYAVAWNDLRKNKGFQGWGIEGTSEASFEDETDRLVAEYVKEWNGTVSK